MIYLIGYLLLYCLSFYLIQCDWRESFDASLADIFMFAFTSLFFVGIAVFTITLFEEGLFRFTGGNKIIWKRYDK